MCAISGIVGWGEAYRLAMKKEGADAAERMKAALKRRGPDADGVYRGENALLVHTRLAVIDPEGGAQPMIYRRGGRVVALVYNGELYNTFDLRRELTALGYQFKTTSDTEAVLLSYVEWGERCVERFNGIFAFAVWDKTADSGKLFLARDRIGVKPLFYALRDGVMYFASEIKGLLCCKGIDAEVSAEGIREIMLIGPARTCGCGIFKGITELCPAECAVFDENGLRKRRYWDMSQGGEFEDDLDQTIEKVRTLVTDAIMRQTVSDAPLCTFLSGGLDSSLISSVTNRKFDLRGDRLHTFSVEYRDNAKFFKAGKFQPNADDEYIAEMVKYLGSVHHRVVVDTPELVDALYTSAEARDLPGMADVDSSLLLFCKAVKESGFKVALSGECADEIFGGYPWYRDPEIRMTDGFPWSQSTAYRASLMKREFLEGVSAEKFVYQKYLDTISKVTDLSDGETDAETAALEKRMREMMRLNMDWFMQTLLDRKDRMSMYWGLEVRVPFCDYRIVEYLYRVPWKIKDYMGREKGLLRKAAEGLLPEKVLYRKKSPYPKTHNPAYTAAVRERLREELSQSVCPVLDILERSEVERLMTAGQGVQWYGQLMNDPQIMAYILQINHWMKVNKVRLVE